MIRFEINIYIIGRKLYDEYKLNDTKSNKQLLRNGIRWVSR